MMASLKQFGVDGDPATVQALVAGHLQQQGITNTSRKCSRCGSSDHVIANCPFVASSNSSNGAPSQQSSDNNWKTVAPAAGTEFMAILHRGGRKYVWCTTCGKWMYHKADKHDAWKARAAARIAAGLTPGAPLPVTAANPATAVASLAAVTPEEDDDWLSFRGRRLT